MSTMSEKQRYQLDRRGEPLGIQLWGVADDKPEGSNGGFLLVGQGYTSDDKVAVMRWMWERSVGYLPLTARQVSRGFPPPPVVAAEPWQVGSLI